MSGYISGYTEILHSHKKERNLVIGIAWMDLEVIRLSEIDKYCVTYMWNLKK